jgi:hypothetical protein
MMQPAGAALLALLLACGTAQAAQWVFVLKSDDGTQEAFVDVSSIRGDQVSHRGWVKNIYKSHTHTGDGAKSRSWQQESVMLLVFNCSEQTVHSESANVYYEDGTHETDSLVTTPEPVPPDTVLSAVMQVVCALKPK